MIKVLMLGDVVGRIGRKAVKKALPQLKKKYAPDLIIANGENIAHGAGVTVSTIKEMLEAGVDFLTSGNHIWDKKEVFNVFADKTLKEKIIRPANYPPDLPGKGHHIVTVAGTKRLLIINLLGRVFFSENFDCPFRKLDAILKQYQNENLDGVVVDFHAEATSEKKAFSYYADGRVSAVLGTHVHTPMADWKILPQGTAHVSEVGMTGAKESIIGVSVQPIIKNFLTQIKQPLEFSESGTCEVNAVLVKINSKTRLATNIKKIYEEVDI